MAFSSRRVVWLVLGGLVLTAGSADAERGRRNKPPRVVLIVPSSATVGQTVTIDGSGTSDPEGQLATWEYSFGDGGKMSSTGRVLVAQHTYLSPGSYTVRLVATDRSGLSASASAVVVVSAPAPPPPQISADGTQVPTATQIVDASYAVWTLASDLRVLRNGVQAAGGYSPQIVWLNQTVYALGLDRVWWYAWNGVGWTPYGQTAPGTPTPAPAPKSSTTTDFTVDPGQSIQAVVDAAPEGASILLRSGLHRLSQSIVPKSGQKWLGETGTVVSGARALTGFSRSNNYWMVAGQTQGGPVIGTAADEVCSPDQARCGYPEDLFIDHVVLKHVSTLAEVGTGRWYFDYVNDRIYIGDDPTGRLVETSVVPFAFEGTATGVTIRGLTVEKFASPTHEAAVNGRGSGWTIENCEVRWNHFAGIRTVDDAIARGNLVHHNGAFGFIGSGRGIQVESNEISYNNTRGYNPYWGAGGSKWVYTDGLVVRGNFSHHNYGPGLWTDIDNIRVLYESNRVEDNDLSGIFHEISYAAVIRNNSLARNGRTHPFPGWVDGAAILIAGSSDVEVYGNTLADNWQGITGLEGHRGSGIYGAWVLQNMSVHENQVTQTGTLQSGSGRSGIIDTSGTGAFSLLRNNRWIANTYWLPSAQPNSFVWAGKDVNETGWMGSGQDVNGTFNR